MLRRRAPLRGAAQNVFCSRAILEDVNSRERFEEACAQCWRGSFLQGEDAQDLYGCAVVVLCALSSRLIIWQASFLGSEGPRTVHSPRASVHAGLDLVCVGCLLCLQGQAIARGRPSSSRGLEEKCNEKHTYHDASCQH